MIIHTENADAAIITANSRKMRIQQYLHTCLTITAIMLRSLQPIAKHLREQGKDDAALQIEKGVEDFEKGNMRLSIALSLVQ